MVTCAVASCSNNTNRNKKLNVTFHSFPMNNQTMMVQWLRFLNSVSNMGTWQPTMWSKICSEHFTPDCFTETKTVRRLKNDAVPTIANKTGAFGTDNAAKALMQLKNSSPLEDDAEPSSKKVMRAELQGELVRIDIPEASVSSQGSGGNVAMSLPIAEQLSELGIDECEIDAYASSVPSASTSSSIVMTWDAMKSDDAPYPPQNEDAEDYRRYPGTYGVMLSLLYKSHLMLLLMLRAMEAKITFKLGSDHTGAGKFDDIVFRYKVGGKESQMCFQVKYSHDERKQLVLSDFIGDKRGRSGKFSLVDLLKSHLNMKVGRKAENKCVLFTNSQICYGNTMRNVTLDDTLLSETYLNFPDIFTENKLVRFRSDEFDYLVSEISNVELEFVRNFTKEFYLATGQWNVNQLEKMVLIQLQGMYKISDKESNVYFACLKSWLTTWQCKEKGTYIDNVQFGSVLSSFKPNSVASVTQSLDAIYNVPGKVVEAFSGRHNEMEGIKHVLDNDKSGREIDVVVTGMAGVGKSQLVHKFVEDNRNNFKHVVWLTASSKEALDQSILDLASMMNVDTKDASVLYKMLGREPCLLVLDDADSLPGVEHYVPPCESNVRVIVTSCNTNWPGCVAVHLDVFSPEKSEEYMGKALQCEHAPANVKKLAKLLGHHPLALHCACRYINQQQEQQAVLGKTYDVADLTRDFSDADFMRDFKDSVTLRAVTEPLEATWRRVAAKLRSKPHGELAEEFVLLASFLGGEDVPVQLLGASDSESDVLSALLLLQRYSVAVVVNQRLQLQPLLGSVALASQTNKQQRLHKVLHLLEAKLKYGSDDIQTYRSHAIAALRHLASGEFSDLALLVVKHTPLGEALSVGQFVDKVEARLDQTGPSNHHRLALLHEHAQLMVTSGQHKDALTKFDEALALHGELPSQRQMQLCLSKARLLQRMHKHDEAFSLYERTYKAYVDQLGKDHPQCLQTLLHLQSCAMALRNTDKPASALQRHTKVFKWIEATLPDKTHPLYVSAVVDQALCLEDNGQLNKALCLLTKAQWLPVSDGSECTVALPVDVQEDPECVQSKLYLSQQILEKKVALLGKHHDGVFRTKFNISGYLSQLGSSKDDSSQEAMDI